MIAEAKRVLFLDGMGCNPTGFKPRFIAGLGYHITAPQLPEFDFPAALEMANDAVENVRPDVIVGYSRGGGIAMMLRDRHIPRLLIAPALRYVFDGHGFDGPLVVLHSATDDSLPLEGVREQLIRCALSSADLRIVGEDHTMIDKPALNELTIALKELTSTPLG